MAEAAFFIIGIAIQYAFVVGSSYILYRFLIWQSGSDLRDVRVIMRLIGVFFTLFALVVSIIRQLVVRESWAEPFLLSLWVIGAFFFHDVALGLAMKRK